MCWTGVLGTNLPYTGFPAAVQMVLSWAVKVLYLAVVLVGGAEMLVDWAGTVETEQDLQAPQTAENVVKLDKL